MKLNKKNYIHILILMGMYLLMVLYITRFTNAYGSTLDWGAQHFAIPDNFRRSFYDSGEFFPSFLFNLGAGENIYNLSYYGLFSPLILLSYLFPFIPMYIYIQIISILGVCVSIFLFYRWVNRKFGASTAFVLTVLFEFSSGYSLHSHRHIMFVSYMPFLILAFGAVEDYFQGKRKFSLVIYTFLCIMCCYFFGVAALAAIVVYAVYEYLRITEKVTFRDLLKKGSHFAGRIITAVLMAGILLLPTLHCMFSGRDAGNSKIDLSSLIPKANIGFFCYDSYGMGLTVIAVIAILNAVISKNKKHTRFLGITMLVLMLLPVFLLVINGGLYVDAKVLIPFVPVCLLLVGRLLEQMSDKSFNCVWCLAVTAALIALAAIFGQSGDYNGVNDRIIKAAVLDLGVMLVLGVVSVKLKKKFVFYGALAAVAVVTGVTVNSNDSLVKNKELDTWFSQDMYDLADTISRDDKQVRTANLINRDDTVNYVYNNDYLVSNIYSSLHNRKYNDFYFNHIYNENEFRNPALTTQSQSLLYQIYMGQKYLITDDNKALPSHEYKKIKQSGELSLYECEKVFPIGYSTSAVLSEEAFSNMDYPRSLCAVMNNIIVPQGGKDSYECNMITSFPSFELPGRTGISRSGSGYEIRLEKTDEFTVELPQKVSADKLLLVTMDIDNDMSGKGLSSDDAKIFINGIKNNLTDPSWKYYNNNKTFRFVVSSTDGKNIETLKLKFMRGNYDVKNIKCYVMDISNFMQVDEFVFDKQKTKGDNIVGSIDVSNDGYFKLSVPYAEGFTAYVDGKETQVECVDTAFVGFAITKGHHDIKITFTAPLKKAGLLMSASGVAVLVVLMVIEFISKKRKKNTSKKDV